MMESIAKEFFVVIAESGLQTTSLILSVVLILISVFPRISIKQAIIEPMSRTGKIVVFVFGILLLVIAFYPIGPKEHRFINPMYNGERLDACNTWGTDCGWMAANKWCREEQGFELATDYLVDPKIGERHIRTRMIGDNSICEHDYCSTFHYIVCR